MRTTSKALPVPFIWGWSFIKGAALPYILLALAVLISIGLGVQAAEDWDGFAGRIDLGKTIAFYVSIMAGILLYLRAKKTETMFCIHKAQTLGLGFALILWVTLL